MTNVKLKVLQEVDLDWEEAQKVVVAVLKEDFDSITNDIVNMRRKSSFEGMREFEKEDLKNWMATRDAIYTMLCYYLEPDMLDSFMRNRSLL
jgi:hypothetical protein